MKMSIRDACIALAVGKRVLEDLYYVEYHELSDNQEEISQQIEADDLGIGINGRR